MIKRYVLVILFALPSLLLHAQYPFGEDDDDKQSPLSGVEYATEAQVSVSDGKTPLWLNANKHGLSSLDEVNGYVRASIARPLELDSMSKWGVGYGVDVAVPFHYTSHVVVQQAYAQLRWLHAAVTVGSKEYAMELKNNKLSSGSQTLGINARPVPQVRIALPDYWILPFGAGWLRIKGHMAYGRMTDDRWQHDFTARQSKYADHVNYHSKAGYLKIGNEDRFFPWSVEMGLETASTFVGTTYKPDNDGTMVAANGETGLKGMCHAFIPGGHEAEETVYQNVAGNQVGSWLLRINYDSDLWGFSLYGDKFFEDHSAMLFVDYDGYGKGEAWNSKEDHRYLLYKMKDFILGAEIRLRDSKWIDHIVGEYVYTKYQSGPVYHDHTYNISDLIGGIDDYYNNYVYTGWQHWGQVIGNPLYRSPLYNDDGKIDVKDNRFMAFHLGVSGQPTDQFDYRILATWQEGLGTYVYPYSHKRHNLSMMAEASYHFTGKLSGWSIKGAYGMDLGSIIGNNYGAQITISKKGVFKL